jgi:DNA polymerase-3 subunit chi
VAKVDFYLLRDRGHEARDRFACKLVEKAYKLKHRVHVIVDDDASVRRMDALLWTFRDGSFVPHGAVGDSDPDTPVTIGCGALPADATDVVVNLSRAIPEGVDAVARVAEVIDGDEQAKTEGRARYAAYRDRGHDLEHHTL